MQFFQYLPQIVYGTNLSTNIMARVKFREIIKNLGVTYYPYTLADGDRADIISHKYYGSAAYTWIILLANDIVDPIYDWPLDYNEFHSYIIGKYGSVREAHQTHHHYENGKGQIIDANTFNLGAEDNKDVSCYEYEDGLNEAKRQIRVIDKTYLQQIVAELRDLLAEED